MPASTPLTIAAGTRKKIPASTTRRILRWRNAKADDGGAVVNVSHSPDVIGSTGIPYDVNEGETLVGNAADIGRHDIWFYSTAGTKIYYDEI